MREDDFTCAKATADLAINHPKITVLTNTVIDSVDGDNAITTVEYHNTKTGEKTKRSANNGEQVWLGKTRLNKTTGLIEKVYEDKDTSLARIIALQEIIWAGQAFMKGSHGISGQIWPLFFTAVYYLIFNGIVTVLLGRLEKKLDYFR